MGPLFMQPIYKDYIWGGNKIKEYLGKDVPFPMVAESWEVSTNDAGLSTIRDQNGMTLKELFEDLTNRKTVFGTKTEKLTRFPLLVKWIDAKDHLSVQVHPNDDYAKRYEKDTGKTEMWYVMDCLPDATLICGWKENLTKEQIEKMIRSGKLREHLKEVPIQKGDVIYIPAGTVHAILKGTLICEIQQNSNITYRVYDWDRIGKEGKPRELHIEKAIAVMEEGKEEIISTKDQTKTCQKVIASPYFQVEKLQITSYYEAKSDPESFSILVVVEGGGFLIAQGKEYELKLGETLIIPATLGEYQIKGNIKLLQAYL